MAGKEILLFPGETETAPLVVLHTVRQEGERVWRAVKEGTGTDFSLAAVDGLNWDDEMSPWAIPPIVKDDIPCSGGADRYLPSLIREIVPGVLDRLPGEPRWLALAGYSLAGLFAFYALWHTDLFARLACASGSFWYPDFLEYVNSREPQRLPERVYFSLGDRESRTRNRVLKPVEENTRRLQEWCEARGIRTTFEMNPGNHFRQTEERMARGIRWILED